MDLDASSRSVDAMSAEIRHSGTSILVENWTYARAI